MPELLAQIINGESTKPKYVSTVLNGQNSHMWDPSFDIQLLSISPNVDMQRDSTIYLNHGLHKFVPSGKDLALPRTMICRPGGFQTARVQCRRSLEWWTHDASDAPVTEWCYPVCLPLTSMVHNPHYNPPSWSSIDWRAHITVSQSK